MRKERENKVYRKLRYEVCENQKTEQGIRNSVKASERYKKKR